MLKEIGVKNSDALYAAIPEAIKRAAPKEDDGLSEFEGIKEMERLAAKNSALHYESYLGGGAYEHHCPAYAYAICQKSEFLTSYTPYQAEISQGLLQSIFEFQSAICAVTGLDVANASLYDGASASAEALLMALRLKKERTKILLSEALHPRVRAVVSQYLESLDLQIETIPFNEAFQTEIPSFDEETAAVLLQSPNYFGAIENIETIAGKAKEKGALTLLSANPLSYGLYASAAELGVDVAIGDCQPLGIPLQFGGPYAGYIACRKELVRQLPGRVVGETRDSKGRRGFTLTLQAREQHIRREKATSNICSNQALAAMASLLTILWYGPKGLAELALTNHQRAAYLKERLEKLPGVTTSEAPFFNEFVVRFSEEAKRVQDHFQQERILPGIPLGRDYPQMENSFLVAVTETKNRVQLDRYLAAAEALTACAGAA